MTRTKTSLKRQLAAVEGKTSSDPLDLFLPPVQHWFRTALGEPTPAQRQGWPVIAAGQNTLILAPTGSGKTLAAFLACLDHLWRQESLPTGVQLLYVSPLKALNNDIYRNLQVPLEGVAEAARQMNGSLPDIRVAVRTGDTPSAERQRLIRKPPHVLITTPESLHLLLTSKARETLRHVTHCIVDEIHALCSNKRGVFLALLLERLAALNPHGFIRIGLSATQRPLEEVARYLGGSEQVDGELVPRPVTIVDAGLRKDLDLRVVSPVEQFGALPEKSIWPSIYRLVKNEIGRHRSTIVFANNRRSVERITANLNETEEIAQAHHGSVSLEVRQQTEQALKDGRLPAVVATASLELGIDMGAVDLVCQVESPGSVARGLQRVGRAGHVVGLKSKGRLIPKTQADLLEQAVLAREMAAGRVEEIRVPLNCLDVLAQQIVAMTAMDDWDVADVFLRLRQAYPYRDLTQQAFEAVLEMISGRYQLGADNALAALQPRVSWDRVHNRLLALPGSQKIAVVNGGTIPDTGQYAAYTSKGVRIGELDEEFIYERRVGESFLLGTNAWRIERIEPSRVIVTPAEGAPAMVPFWRGEQTGRSFDLGLALGRFLRELSERIEAPDCLGWLEHEFFLDPAAARNLKDYVHRQFKGAGCLPTDRTLVVEASRDQLGDWQVVLLCPFGSRLNLSLRLALESVLSRRLGYRPQCLHHDDGILIRLADMDEPFMDLFEGLTPENVQQMILEELADSPLFALRFRQNAARSLLLPQMRVGKRAPLWLQRHRGRDLLQVARRHPDFPIVVETFRECLHDHLDVPRLQQLLADIRAGHIDIVRRRAEVPSPFTSGLLFAFVMASMYHYDDTEAASSKEIALDPQLLEQILGAKQNDHLLDPRAIQQVDNRLQSRGQPPRSVAEMAERLRKIGDLIPNELEGPMAEFLHELEADSLVRQINLPATGSCADNVAASFQLAGSDRLETGRHSLIGRALTSRRESPRWILAEEEDDYNLLFRTSKNTSEEPGTAAERILARYLDTHAIIELHQVLERYPLDISWTERKLNEWTQSGRLVRLATNDDAGPARWSVPANLEQVQRGSLALLRREVVPCSPAQFADFTVRWQGLHPTSQRHGLDGLAHTLSQVQGLHVSAELWEQTILPNRVRDYQTRWLDELTAGGEWCWVCRTTADDGAGLLAFVRREQLRQMPPPSPESSPLEASTEQVLEYLRHRGASFLTDIAQDAHLSPSGVRAALWTLLRGGLVTNDRFDVIRRGEPRLAVVRRTPLNRPEGRWSLIPWGHSEPEIQAILHVSLLLQRYGIVARELAQLDPYLLPWRVLYDVLMRMELAGDVRRGYFVEGMSGTQFALPDAARSLHELTSSAQGPAPALLLHSLDPANLYGSGAPFDIPLLDGSTRPLTRRSGNWLVLRAGQPVLLIEQQGKRLSALASASREDVRAAAACLPRILDRSQSRSGRHKLTVEEWNGKPVTTTAGRELLESVGFVRDYQAMTLYAVQMTPASEVWT